MWKLRSPVGSDGSADATAAPTASTAIAAMTAVLAFKIHFGDRLPE
jgi:hypothetical protein